MNTISYGDAPSVIRLGSRVAIVGREFTVRFIPLATGRIAADVIAQPVLTGFKESCVLNNPEAITEFHPEDIRQIGNSLECMRKSDYGCLFWEGFRVLLEPGMSEQIAQAS